MKLVNYILMTLFTKLYIIVFKILIIINKFKLFFIINKYNKYMSCKYILKLFKNSKLFIIKYLQLF